MSDKQSDDGLPALTVGNLPTVNQDPYPALGDCWVQLWDDDKVFARVYGDGPQQAMSRATAVAAALAARQPEPVGGAWQEVRLTADGSIHVRDIPLSEVYASPAPQAAQADSRALALLRESRNTLFMWRDVAPAVSLLDDIDKFLATTPPPDGKAEQAAEPESPCPCWPGHMCNRQAECFASAAKAEQAEAPSDIEDAKEELAALFFQCARYERPSTDWRAALDAFCNRLATQPTASNAGERPMADTLSFICTNGCGSCGVKLRDFVTHATQAQDSDTWVTVASEPEIVSTCCGHPVEVWDERKQDVVAEVRAALATQPTASNADKVLMPKRMTQAMLDVTDAENWTWEDLMAAAEAITEAEYNELAASPTASNAGERELLDTEGIERLETELFFRRRRLRETHTHPENIEDPGFFDGFHAAEAYYGITTKEQS